MSRYKNIKFILISPDELSIPEYLKTDILDKNNIKYVETDNLEKYMPELDVLYMTRVQKERFFNEADYIKLKNSYVLDEEKLKNAKDDLCIMHPLPRVNEVSVKVDKDPRACYFKQAEYGKFIRMALILKLLEIDTVNTNNNLKSKEKEEIINRIKCKNPRCITSVEQELDQVFILTDNENKIYRCKYCESKAK